MGSSDQSYYTYDEEVPEYFTFVPQALKQLPRQDEDSAWNHLPNPELSDELVPVVMAFYKTPECLVCYAFVYQVLYVSSVHEYVWMVEKDEKEAGCDCKQITGHKYMHNRHSYRQVSVVQAERFYFGHVNGFPIKSVEPEKIPIIEAKTSKSS